MKLLAKKLLQNQIDAIVQKKMNWITSNSDPLKVILFGSASNGEMTEASDVDIILIFPNYTDLKKIVQKMIGHMI
jgi:predicted nucleotidyltransferase